MSPTSHLSNPSCSLFDGKYCQSNRGILKSELFIQYVDVEGSFPDDGSQPRSEDKNIFPTIWGESQGQHVTKHVCRNPSQTPHPQLPSGLITLPEDLAKQKQIPLTLGVICHTSFLFFTFSCLIDSKAHCLASLSRELPGSTYLFPLPTLLGLQTHATMTSYYNPQPKA